jgi:adenosylcobinamide kinase/adenosylcobinamide-phosphate guanylyltransferase
MKVLVTGGVRSGKSHHAESLLADRSDVTYVAPGPSAAEDPDPDWAVRIAAHQARRPGSWTTLETHDLASALATRGPLLVDCLGTWLTAVLDAASAWDLPASDVHEVVDAALAPAVAALADHPGPVALVTNEVGLGVVPAHRSGRLFRDLLGTVNQRLASGCDEVHLVVAGRVLVL